MDAFGFHNILWPQCNYARCETALPRVYFEPAH